VSASTQGYGPDVTSPFSYGLHHVLVAIPPGGEDACRPFYVDVLGMTELVKPPRLAAKGGLWVRADGVEIHLGVERDFRPARKAHPGIRVVGLSALESRLTEAGFPVEWDGDFPGHRRFYTSDPHGNRLEFIERDESAPAGW
jgi:catechol 2,3-dioxygenase-like lactoylglutathione lyase family enzyme